jgi:hypothetical protein
MTPSVAGRHSSSRRHDCEHACMADHATWETLELPLLQEIRHSELEGTEPDIEAFFAARDIPTPRATRVLDRLRDDGYIAGMYYKPSGTGVRHLPTMTGTYLGPPGMRAVGAWPSGDAAEAFVAALEAAIENTREPAARSGLERLLGAFKAVPAGVTTQVVAQALMRAAAGMG